MNTVGSDTTFSRTRGSKTLSRWCGVVNTVECYILMHSKLGCMSGRRGREHEMGIGKGWVLLRHVEVYYIQQLCFATATIVRMSTGIGQ